jgi:hypothetical protein
MASDFFLHFRWRPKLLSLLRTSALPAEAVLREETEKVLSARKADLMIKSRDLAAARAAQAATLVRILMCSSGDVRFTWLSYSLCVWIKVHMTRTGDACSSLAC